MLNNQEFEKYGLEGLLNKPKHAIDISNVNDEDITKQTIEVFNWLKRYRTAYKFEMKYNIHGATENLQNDFREEFAKVRLDPNLVTLNPQVLVNKLELKARAAINKFSDLCKNDVTTYTDPIADKLCKEAQDVKDIFPDEETTYAYADVVAFENVHIDGYKYSDYKNKLHGICLILGALNVFPEIDLKTKAISNMMKFHLINAGFSFEGNMIWTPKEENVYTSDTAKNLGWTPARVHEQNNYLDTAIKLESKCDVLSHILPQKEDIKDGYYVPIQVENCYNLRKVNNYVKNTLYYLCLQYLQMVRSYR